MHPIARVDMWVGYSHTTPLLTHEEGPLYLETLPSGSAGELRLAGQE